MRTKMMGAALAAVVGLCAFSGGAEALSMNMFETGTDDIYYFNLNFNYSDIRPANSHLIIDSSINSNGGNEPIPPLQEVNVSDLSATYSKENGFYFIVVTGHATGEFANKSIDSDFEMQILTDHYIASYYYGGIFYNYYSAYENDTVTETVNYLFSTPVTLRLNTLASVPLPPAIDLFGATLAILGVTGFASRRRVTLTAPSS